MSRALATITRALGGLGCAARAVVFALTGFFIVEAAVLSSSKPGRSGKSLTTWATRRLSRGAPTSTRALSFFTKTA